ncbi:diguanylate cyclase [Niveibacterium umoris]|uniref:diguanylate cyclase n=1 Tax=Niveibacterium umoris TaxID=1193620 RepID=A0A840BGN0_9RHOO|nr:diguanylate cyclase [Niveibacterium umoris]MBB4010752.1 diguanylate cyclase (GGDEF)-like protein [Niveibacterium umoris]
MKALLIEDSLTSATLIAHQLRAIGIEPLLAREGEEGIELFKAHRPDLVLLDVILPGMDGFEVAKRIRQLEQHGEWTPIIFLSARTGDDDLQRGIEVGGDDYLFKPISSIVLAAKVRAMQRISQMRYSLVVLTRRLDDANRELQRLSSIDGLTGIANRRQYDAVLIREWRRAQRRSAPIALVVCDVDYFKRYNDHFGHQGGDECLRQVARALAGQAKRPADLVARYGGEEFAVILPDTDAEGALLVAEGMRIAVNELELPHAPAAGQPFVSISLGVAAAVPPREAPTPGSLMSAADAALYEAKRLGRNRVLLAQPLQA